MKECGLVSANDTNAWNGLVTECFDSDTYHCVEYHRLAELQGEGESCLFYFRSQERLACFPLMLRQIGGGRMDATSVYGYPGVLTSVQQPDAAFAAEFQDAFLKSLQKQRVVTVFSRLHPMIKTGWLLAGMSQLENHGLTVWIDLTRSENDQMCAASQQHRRHLRKAQSHGLSFRPDLGYEHLELFIEMYEATMRRNKASAYYFFPPEYYQRLRSELAGSTRLFLAELQGKIVSATMVLATRRYIHFHLNGTPEEFLVYNCSRFLLNAIRQWATTNGYHWMNLGGGVGARADSLFQFKAGFSDLHIPFQTARIVVDTDAYSELMRQHPISTKDESSGDDYFPRYRVPSNN